MKKEDQDYYDQLFDTFASDGWKIFISMQTEAYKVLEERSRIDCPDNDLWQFRRGELDKLWKVINFEQLVRNNYDGLEIESSHVVESEQYDPLH